MKIFDCFPFFDELLLLDMRLYYLMDSVKKFVLVEGTYSHQGLKKKLFFEENKSEFKKYKNKIIHIIVDDYPLHNHDTHSEFIYDYHTRNGIAKGLNGNCASSDVVMISDVDEFPDKKKFALFNGNITVFKMITFYFKINLRCKNFQLDNGDGLWPGTKMLKFSDFDEPQKIRNIRAKKYGFWRFNKKKINILLNAGWHFRFLGDEKNLFKEFKNRAIGRTEQNLKRYNIKDLRNIISNKLPLIHSHEKYNVIPFNKMPNFIKTYKRKLKNFII
jgi:beta-1,4-mannosyl-glycoprotein beta-1,4-N-acetylglucosaminyltransferase